jgi:hypothetical protein
MKKKNFAFNQLHMCGFIIDLIYSFRLSKYILKGCEAQVCNEIHENEGDGK